MKTFKGKAIYNPSGKAGEYSYWACNFYMGCSNNCNYCYCKSGRLGRLWSTVPRLKASFKDEAHALEIFEKELKANLPELQKHGLFFTFTSDPLLPNTIRLTDLAIMRCVANQIPVQILTKCTDWFSDNNFPTHGMPGGSEYIYKFKKYVAFGFTLTGHDELEPNASPNAERIQAMRKLHEAGFKTWASVEPIIDMNSVCDIIRATEEFCDLYKIGLMSGKQPKPYKPYKPDYLRYFIYHWLREDFIKAHIPQEYRKNKFYFKDSLLKAAGIDRANLPGNCVGRDYNLFYHETEKQF